MNDLGALLATLVLLAGLSVALAVFGAAAARFGVDSRRPHDEDRLGGHTPWI
jgi:hypothetical protein